MPHPLELTSSPPIFILPTRLHAEELHEIEDLIFQTGGTLTYDPKEARVFIGRVDQKKRAAFELRSRGVWTEETPLPEIRSDGGSGGATREDDEAPARKKAKFGSPSNERDVRASTRQQRRRSSTVSTAASDVSMKDDGGASAPYQMIWPDLSDHVLVLKLAWLETSLKQEQLVPYEPYTVYTAKVVPKPAGEISPTTPRHATRSTSEHAPMTPSRRVSKPSSSILERAKAEAATIPSSSASSHSRRRFGHPSTSPTTATKLRPPKLQRTTTSEFESLAAHPLPPLPSWATGPTASYACCRSTPMSTPNAAFIAQLTKIKEARLLTLDDIGVRAYSTSIASLSAYPHPITHAEEITRLPGCEAKIAALWREWFDSASSDPERSIASVRALDADTDLQHLRTFWNIWGVGPETARKFYFEHGWKDLDDVVEYGWHGLTRVQQIGVKYYDEFLDKIPRAEVEGIRDVIVRHARTVLGIADEHIGTSGDVECIIVGGYRRGKEFCGDVDVILSHREEEKTQDLVVDVVRSLEAEGWVTHTLSLHTTTSDRGQATLPFRAAGRGHGFDSLDKALCVWQDPNFETSGQMSDEGGGSEEKDKAKVKNPNIHRRVDIIISSWRTVGCAVLGWSGGTTFQRDIRRFVSKTKGWKFDSSGVRDRGSGLVLDLEAARPQGLEGVAWALKKAKKGGKKGTVVDKPAGEMDDADTWQDRERRLMEGLGIGYRPPEERCTG